MNKTSSSNYSLLPRTRGMEVHTLTAAHTTPTQSKAMEATMVEDHAVVEATMLGDPALVAVEELTTATVEELTTATMGGRRAASTRAASNSRAVSPPETGISPPAPPGISPPAPPALCCARQWTASRPPHLFPTGLTPRPVASRALNPAATSTGGRATRRHCCQSYRRCFRYPQSCWGIIGTLVTNPMIWP